MTEQTRLESATTDYLRRVRTRLTLQNDYRDTTTQSFAMIAAGFGRFGMFDGRTLTDRNHALPLSFALAMTAVGVVVVLMGMGHLQMMTAGVDADVFGTLPAPALPDERRSVLLAIGAIAIGLVSFIALLLLR